MAKAKARRVDFYPDEYIAGVGGVLRADEQGVYWMICTLIMSEGHEVFYDEKRFAGLCQIRPSDVRRIVDRLVERGKIVRQSDGKLTQNRAQSEVEKSLNRIQTAHENGSNGGRPSLKTQQNQQNQKPNGFEDEKTNHQPPTSNHQPLVKGETIVSLDQSTREDRRSAIDREFEEKFWLAYPRKVSKGQAVKAYRTARKEASLEVILAALEQYAKQRAGKDPQYTKHPSVWLNAKSWLDEVGSSPAARDVDHEIYRNVL